MRLDQPEVALPVGLPDLAQQRLALQHPARPGGQGGQQVELGAGQVDDGAVDPHLAALLVDLELGEPADRLLGLGRGPAGAGAVRGKRSIACTRATSSRGRERLGHVPVGADGQTDEQVDLLGAGGQHEDVALGLGADLPADLGAVGVGQPEVEHDEVGGLATDLLQARRPGADRADVESRPVAAPW